MNWNAPVTRAGWTVLACLAIGLAPIAARAEAPEKIATVEGITEYRLGNGLRILLFPDPSTSSVTVNLTVLVGSRHEGYGETGMAHLLEHMVFKGTPKHPNITKSLVDHGARYNGSTNSDRTNYFETLPATDENLQFALDMEADRLVNSFVKKEDLASEMTVVRSEFESGENSPVRVLMQRMAGVAYEWHNYGKSTIGNRSDIERVPIENLQAFYKKFYQPDNVVLIVAGNFEEPKALELIGQSFGALKKPERKLDETYTEEPPQDGERTVTLRRVGTVGSVGVAYHIPAAAHDDFAAVQVLADVLTTEPTGRLYQALVKTGKATSVRGGAQPEHDPGLLQVMAQTGAGQSVEAARDALLESLESASTTSQAFTDADVQRSRTKFKTQMERMVTDSNRVGIMMSEWAAKGDWRLFFLHRDRIAKVTAADVDRVAAKYLTRNNRTVGLYLPSKAAERAEVPPTPSIAALVKDYKGSQSVTVGEAFDPTPKNIEDRVRRSEMGNGLKVAVLPKKTRGQTVTMELVLRYGNEESLRGQNRAAALLPRLMARGTKAHSRQQIQDEFNRLGVQFSEGGSTGEATFSMVCKRKSLPEALKLMGEILREPTFPEEEFSVLKRQEKEGLNSQLTEPNALATEVVRRRLNPYDKEDVRYVPTMPEAISRLDALTRDQVRKLYTEQLGAQAGELVLVGDCDPEETPKLIEQLLKDWKPAIPYKRITRPSKMDVEGDRVVIDTPDKANAVFVAAHSLGITDSDPDYAALKVGDFLFGEASLSSRLAVRVRQKEGLSYTVRASLNAGGHDKAGQFQMYAICNPANIDKVDTAIADELDKMLKNGVQEKELADAKEAYLKAQKNGRSSDGALAAQLANTLNLGRTFTYYAELEKRIEELKPEDVNAAFKKHIQPKRLVVVRAGDFKPKKPAGTETK